MIRKRQRFWRLISQGQGDLYELWRSPPLQREIKGSSTAVDFWTDKVLPLVHSFTQLLEAPSVFIIWSHTGWAPLEKFPFPGNNSVDAGHSISDHVLTRSRGYSVRSWFSLSPT